MKARGTQILGLVLSLSDDYPFASVSSNIKGDKRKKGKMENTPRIFSSNITRNECHGNITVPLALCLFYSHALSSHFLSSHEYI